MRVKAQSRLGAMAFIVAMVLSIGFLVLGPASPAHADPSCMTNGGIYLVFVRGSGEDFDDSRARPFRQDILAAINRPPRIAATTAWSEVGNLDGNYILEPKKAEYPAVGWADWGIFTHMDGYYASVRIGTAELFVHLIDRVMRCPKESIVLAGYSQGADVIGNVLSWLDSSLTGYVLNHIGYVALYGDPHANACEPGRPIWGRGNAKCGHGILGPRIPYIPSSISARTGSWCDSSDGVCTGDVTRLPIANNPLSTHASAYQNTWIMDSSDEIANKALDKLNELNPSSPPVSLPSYTITPPNASDPPPPTYPSSDNTRLALPSGAQYIWQRGVTLPVDYPDAVRYNNEGNSGVQLNWTGPMNSISLPPNTVVRPVGGNQQYLWSSDGQLLPIGDPATAACYLFSFPQSNPSGQPAIVPADWASGLPHGAQGQCSLGDEIRFTQSDTGSQQYISIRGAALPVSYGDAQALDAEGDPYHPLTMPAGYVSNPIHTSVPANTVLRAAGNNQQYFWDGTTLHAIPDPEASQCQLMAFPQNGVAVVPPSWIAGKPTDNHGQCSLADETRFTESTYSGTQQYVSVRGAAIPLGYSEAQWYDQSGNSSVIDMVGGYVENPIHAAVLPVHTMVEPTDSNAQYIWEGNQMHYVSNPATSACLLVAYPQNGVARIPAGWLGTLAVGSNATCPFEGRQLLAQSGRVDYVTGGSRHYVPNPAIRDCLKGRSGTGDPIAVDDSTISSYPDSGANAYCPYETEHGLNFVQEAGSPIVWLVGPATGNTPGVKRHAGSLCVNDPYTTQIKAAHVFTVPAGETAGHVQGQDWWPTSADCQGLPQG